MLVSPLRDRKQTLIEQNQVLKALYDEDQADCRRFRTEEVFLAAQARRASLVQSAAGQSGFQASVSSRESAPA